MRNVRIIGDDIYYKDVLVAKLVNSPMRTIQGEFVDNLTIQTKKVMKICLMIITS